MTVLKLIADSAIGAAGVAANEWFLSLPGSVSTKPGWPTRVTPGLLDLTIANQLDPLERSLGRPNANRTLPLEVRLHEVREWLRLDAEISSLHAARWTAVRDPDALSVLTVLACAAAEV